MAITTTTPAGADATYKAEITEIARDGLFIPNINVRQHGLAPGSGNATANTTAFTALLATLDNSAATLYFPGTADGTDDGVYYLNGEFSTPYNGIRLTGDGVFNSAIVWEPTADNQTFFTWEDTGSDVSRGGITDLYIKTTDTTYTKTVLKVVDGREFYIGRIFIYDFNNNDSIGLVWNGKDTSTITDLTINAARPIVFEGNPNHAYLDADMVNMNNLRLNCVGSTHPGIEFETGVFPYDIGITGNNFIAGGTSAIKINTTGTNQPSMILIDNLRHEQITTGSTYSFDIVANATGVIQRVIMRGCKCGTNANGIKLAHVRAAVIEGHKHTQNNKVALNLDSVRVCEIRACDLGGTGGGSTNTASLTGVALDTTADLFAAGETGLPCSAVYLGT